MRNIIVTYVDDCIILGKDMAIMDSVISSLKEGHTEFELVDQGGIDKYVGLLIRDIDANTFEMSQPFLIRCILEFLSLDENKSKGRDTPVKKSLLNRDLDGIWLYPEGVGMLIYLANSIRPEIHRTIPEQSTLHARHHGDPNATLTTHPTRIPSGGSPSSSRRERRG